MQQRVHVTLGWGSAFPSTTSYLFSIFSLTLILHRSRGSPLPLVPLITPTQTHRAGTGWGVEVGSNDYSDQAVIAMMWGWGPQPLACLSVCPPYCSGVSNQGRCNCAKLAFIQAQWWRLECFEFQLKNEKDQKFCILVRFFFVLFLIHSSMTKVKYQRQ